MPRSRTGKGWQLFFKHPGTLIPNRAGIISGLDVRGDGGYVVASPSIHPSGKVYKWEVPLTGELPELPVDLFKLISSPTENGSESGYRERFDTARALAGVAKGQRDETLFRLACKLRAADIPQDVAERLILEAARNCDPPFSEQVALKKVRNAYGRYEPRESQKFDSAPRTESVRNGILPQTWGEFINTDFGGLPYTVRNILIDQGLAVIHGRGKEQKSTLAIHALRAIATGMDRKTHKER